MLGKMWHERIYRYALAGAFVTLPLNMRLNVLCLIMLFANWLLEGGFRRKFMLLKPEPFFIVCVLMYCWYIIELLFTDNLRAGWFAVEKKTALLVLPLVILSSKETFGAFCDTAFRIFAFAMAAVMVFCIGAAFVHYLQTGSVSQFVYHALAGYVGQSAIYLSLLCMIAALYLQLHFHQFQQHYRRAGIAAWILLSISIVLLSSKLHVILYAVLSVGFALRYIIKRRSLMWGTVLCLLICAALLIFTDNPVKKRYLDINPGRVAHLREQRYTTADYFDGAAIRLLLWSFCFEILDEEHAWIAGVSPGDNQALLNEKISSYGLHEGYLNYDYHNQYIETLAGCGLAGLLLLLFMIAYLLRLGWRSGVPAITCYIILFSVCFITEAFLEMEIGIVSFVLVFSLLITSIGRKPQAIYDAVFTNAMHVE